MKARELQIYILQTICDCDDNDCYCAVPLAIKFLVPNADLPQHQSRSTVSRQIRRDFSPSRFVLTASSEEESSVPSGIPYAVIDTNTGIPTIISEEIGDSVKSTGNDVNFGFVPRSTVSACVDGAGSGTGPFSSNGSESVNNSGKNDGNSVDVRISFDTTKVVNAFVTSVEEGTHSEDLEMPPEKEREQHHVQQLLYNWSSTLAGPHCLSLRSELMRYHPIDRGRFHLIAN